MMAYESSIINWMLCCFICVFFFKQKTAYEMRISDWSSDVCSSDLMTAEFYLQTVDVVFQRHALPKGRMRHRGRKVDLGAITDVPILAIEGERDDISEIGRAHV